MDINLTNKDGVKLNTAGKYCAEDINVIPQLDTTTVTPAKGQQVIEPSNNKIGFSSVTVEPIPDDYVIPSGTQQITENGTYDVSGKANAVVNVESQPKEEQEKSITITENGSFTVTPDSGKVLSEVTGTVNVPTSGGGADLNIAYGDTAPSDTSKLWIKSTKPTNVTVSCNPEQQVEGFNTDTGITGVTLPTSGPKIAIGTKIYVIGGYNSTAIFEIDTIAKTVVTLDAVLPVNMSNNGGAAAIGNDIYIFYHPKTTTDKHANYVYKLNTISKELTTIRSETAQSGGYYEYYNAIPYGTDIYLHVKAATDTTSDGGKIMKYNTLANSYTTVLSGSKVTAWGWAATAIIGDVIYIFGGGNNNSSGSNTIAKFNISTGEYTVLESTLPVIDYKLTAIAMGTKVYLFGGQTYQSVVLFDSITETVTLLSNTLPITIRQNGGACVANIIWLAYTDICQYIVNFPLSNNDILIQQSYNKNIIDILSAPTRVQIGVRNVYKGNASNKAEFVDAYIHNGTNWVNVNTGGVIIDGHTVTISMREQGEYDVSAFVYVDDSTTHVEYNANTPVTVKANSKIYIDAKPDPQAVGWSGTFRADVTGGVTLTASDETSATFAVTGDGTIVTNGITD